MGQYKREHAGSSMITSVAYDEFSQVLEVVFCNGGIYEYANINESTYQEFLDADSQGKFFNEEIRQRHRYRKVRD